MPRANAKRPSRVKAQTILLCVSVLFLSLLLWAISISFSVERNILPLRVWMFDVGQGDSFLIEFPTGEQMLVDGGRNDAILTKIGEVLPPWDRTLDAILVSHPDADHITGLVSVLDRYRVETLYETGMIADTQVDRALRDAIEDEGAQIQFVSKGDRIQVGDVLLRFLWPAESYDQERVSDRNNSSMVFVLEYGETTVLFTGDAELEAEEGFMDAVGDVDVLKVGHHGSLSSTSWEFLRQIRPEIALISAGVNNTYGHPHPVVLSRLVDWGVELFRTDLEGDILLTSFGGEPEVTVHPLPF
ncbi:MBL fold metallo-hydrolase [Candidatus Uhrbacteria bacterium]|nr:MBL fold metallo-hydrolase [Candidatus Uhrbacteria bacterium]